MELGLWVNSLLLARKRQSMAGVGNMVCLADMAIVSDASAGCTELTTALPRKQTAQRSLFSGSDGVPFDSGRSVEAEKIDDEDGDLNVHSDGDDEAHGSNDSDYECSDSEVSHASDVSTAVSQRQQMSRKRKRVVSNKASNRAAPFACSLCGESFTTPQRLTAHTQLPHDFVCDIEGCGRRFADEELAIRHVTAWHEVRDNERYVCEPCNGFFLTRHDLELHRQQLRGCGSTTQKPLRLFVCDVVPTCKHVYKKKDKLAQHLKRYHEANDDGEAFECDRCTESFPTRHERQLHRQVAHPDQGGEPKSPSYACEVIGCGKSYSKREHLTRHVRATHAAPQEKPFGCHLCGVRFVYKHGLTRHYDNCHSVDAQKPYSCPVCLLAFKKKSLLQAHSYVHTGVLPFECGDCGEHFLKKFQLARHERSHMTQKPSQTQVFLCDEEGCDELLFSKDEKAEHMLQAHGRGVKDEPDTSNDTDTSKKKKEKAKRPSSADIGRKLRCLVCEREFDRVQNLRSHLRTHFEAVDERKQHVCPMEGCDKAYTKKSNVMAHYNAVHDPVKSRRFKCPYDACDGAFGYKTVLANHIASVHERRAMKMEEAVEFEEEAEGGDEGDEDESTPRKKQRRGRAAMGTFTRLLGLNQVGHEHEEVEMATLGHECQNTVDSEGEE